ncbi:ATP-binding protein [Lysinibacillus xylanilyticus]|uniref:ATP-binding protein n=1 Tax=Lysinibacillus xylanilyticus TaxID=582475 RepID=UPI003D056BE2
MKIFLRFIFHFISVIGLLAFFMLFIYILLAQLITNFMISPHYFHIYAAIIFGISFVIFAGLYSWYVIQPMIYLISWIKLLSQGKLEKPYKKTYLPSLKKVIPKWLRKSTQYFEELEDHMEQLTYTLEQNKRLQKQLDQSKREWLSGVSHDLKTPLSYLKAYSSLLLSSDYKWSEEEKSNSLKIIYEKSLNIESLIEDMNLLFQSENGDLLVSLKGVNIIDFVENIVIDMANSPLAEGYNLSFETNIFSLHMKIDKKLMNRALSNLILNAIVHNPPGTDISISISYNEDMNIYIKDNGIGMDEDTLEHLFEKYYRNSKYNRSHSSGLGMSIAQSFIVSNGGKISVISKINEGTSIKINLQDTNNY